MEYFDVCDAAGEPTGAVVARDVAHREGIRHRTAHVWVVRRVGGRWQVLLQKRAAHKDSFPGKYDTSSAGHVRAGDAPLESAIRELEEELGIRAAPEELSYAGSFDIKYEKEFHGRLFRDNEFAQVYVYDRPVDVAALRLQAEEVELLTLHPTDHMLFLLLHALKHFLHSGVGIRQLTDMVLFAQNYGPEIDWTHVERALREVNGFSFTRALFAIGEQYLTLDRGRAHLPDTWGGAGIDPADLLLDMLSGGDMGTADLNRMHASSLTLEAVNADRTGRKNRGIFTALFPPLSGMQARFPYLRKRPYFLPAAYVQRIILYLMGRNSSSGPQPDRVLKIGEMRTALLREYEIIDTDRS